VAFTYNWATAVEDNRQFVNSDLKINIPDSALRRNARNTYRQPPSRRWEEEDALSPEERERRLSEIRSILARSVPAIFTRRHTCGAPTRILGKISKSSLTSQGRLDLLADAMRFLHLHTEPPEIRPTSTGVVLSDPRRLRGTNRGILIFYLFLLLPGARCRLAYFLLQICRTHRPRTL
jgi:hypothetical protein